MRGRVEKEPPPVPPFIFSAVPRSQKTVLLFEWEIPVLDDRAKQLSVEFKVVPNDMFWDDVSGVPIVLYWNLDHDNCPFLSNENLCLIHEEKPLGCQAYPLMAFGLVNENERRQNVWLLDCPNVAPIGNFKEGKMTKVKVSTVYREAFQAYGSTFVGMLRLDAAGLLLAECLKHLVKEWIVYPAIIDEEVKKSLFRERPVGLLKHLKSKRPDLAEELMNSVKSIYEVDTAFIEKMLAQDKRRSSMNPAKCVAIQDNH